MRSDSAMPYRIRVRVLPEEKLAMQKAARRLGVTLSDFVRHATADATRRVDA